MNLKPVELQMAIPRATETGKVQQQMQQKPQLDQAMLQEANSKLSDKNAQRTTETEESNQEKVRDEKKDSDKEKDENEKKKGAQTTAKSTTAREAKQPEHPYKGSRLDIKM
jgi:hypothetical protein